MKKALAFLSFMVITLICSLGLVACGNNGNGGQSQGGEDAHEWQVVYWEWNLQAEEPIIIAYCVAKDDSSLTKDVVATYSVAETEGNCVTEITYSLTATVVVGGTTFTDVKTYHGGYGAHDWEEPVWSWSDDYLRATALFVCKNSDEHTEERTATVTEDVKTQPSCTEDGVKTFTATVTVNGVEYTDEREMTLNHYGHAYQYAGCEWNADHTQATATFVCCNDESHVETVTSTEINVDTYPASCLYSGSKNYTVTFSFEGWSYTGYDSITLEKTSHDWAEPEWEWSGFSSAYAIFSCNNAVHNDREYKSATITDGITQNPTCIDEGVRTYTATVTFDGKEYTDSKTDTVPTAAHNYVNHVCSTCGADEPSTQGVQFALLESGDSYQVTGYNGDVRNVYVAPEHEGKPVTKIASNAFTGGNFTTVVLSDSITEIGAYAFSNYYNMGFTEITLGKGIVKIGEQAFYSCSGLKAANYTGTVNDWAKIEFEDFSANPANKTGGVKINGEEVTTAVLTGITEIKGYSFYNFKSLESVSVPDGVTKIGNAAFCGCEKLESANIPAGVTEIGNSAFSDCKLTEIDIPDTVETIGFYAFNNCPVENASLPAFAVSYLNTDSLKTLVIISGDSIYERVFDNCATLVSVTLPKELKSVGSYAFRNCSALTSVNFTGTVQDWAGINFANADANPVSKAHSLKINGEPVTGIDLTGVTAVGKYAFYGLSGINELTIPDTVTSVGDGAFGNMELETVTASIPTIHNKSFLRGMGIKNLILTGGNYLYRQGLFSYEVGSTTEKYFPALESVVIPASVTDTATDVFKNYSTLKSVTFESGIAITEIKSNMFYNCSALTDIDIPESVTQIGWYAFSGCSALESILIKKNVTKIGDSAFSGCSAAGSITFAPDTTIATIEGSAFAGCSSVTEITIPDTVTTMGTSVFSGCNGLAELTVLKFYTSNSSNALPQMFGTYNGAEVPSSLKKVTVKSGTIGSAAFKDCSSIVEIIFTEDVTSIAQGALSGCASLKTLTIPFTGNSGEVYESSDYVYPFGYVFGSDQYIGGRATRQQYKNGSSTNYSFKDVNYYIPVSLKTVTVLSGIVTAKDFVNCVDITDMTFGDGVICVLGGFNNCTSLKNVTIGKNADIVKFTGCASLETVTVSEESIMDTIFGDAFNGCTSLKEITIPAVKEMRVTAFKDCDSLKTVNYGGTINDWVAVTIWAYNTSEEFYTGNPLSSGADLVIDGEIVRNVVIPEGTTYVGQYIFYGYKPLESVTIPKSVTEFGAGAFYGTELKKVYYGGSVDDWATIVFTDHNYSYNDRGNNPLAYADELIINGETVTEATVSATWIRPNVFKGYKALKTLVIENTVQVIQQGAFADSGLVNVTVKADLKYVAVDVFTGCDGIVYTESGNAYYLGDDANPYRLLVKGGNEQNTGCHVNANTTAIVCGAFWNSTNNYNVTFGAQDNWNMKSNPALAGQSVDVTDPGRNALSLRAKDFPVTYYRETA